MTPTFAKDTAAIPLIALTREATASHLAGLPPSDAAWLSGQGFDGQIGSVACLPDGSGAIKAAYAGLGAAGQTRTRFGLSAAAARLPAGTYDLQCDLRGPALDEAALGLLLLSYQFTRYKAGTGKAISFVPPKGVDAEKIEVLAQSEFLTRDLINTPAEDMGPDHLQAEVETLAKRYGASVTSIIGVDLLSQNLPLIHSVGRAAEREPRLIDLKWGSTGPKLTLVGKGVCFDTGGLNLKPGASMGLMKKDMGGAATVLGLAQMIMALGLKVQLRVLIPAVENNLAGSAFRPGDVLTSRKGPTIEVNNTDAEGRLVLADALALAEEDNPDQILSMATLTGAARVAVGPDLAPFFTTSPDVADALRKGASMLADPVWELPFHDPYESMIEPAIADLDNAPKGGFAGSITAALFLRRFVTQTPYTHFDIYGWQPSASPARPVGGVGQGARAVFAALPDILGL